MESKAADVFVIMPFGGEDNNDQFVSRLVYDNIIHPAFTKALLMFSSEHPGQGGTLFRIDNVYVEAELKMDIIKRLEDSAVVIADVSGNNANVLFELGFRYAKEKPFLCI